MKATIKALMEANSTLATLLTGGIHTSREIERNLTSTAFDANNELKPCALIKAETEASDGPAQNSGRQFFAIYLYQRGDYDVIDQCLPALYSLLHKRRAGTAVWEISHVADIRDQEDQALDASMHVARFQAMRHKASAFV